MDGLQYEVTEIRQIGDEKQQKSLSCNKERMLVLDAEEQEVSLINGIGSLNAVLYCYRPCLQWLCGDPLSDISEIK